jgi:hypothetical protein
MFGYLFLYILDRRVGKMNAWVVCHRRVASVDAIFTDYEVMPETTRVHVRDEHECVGSVG